jgi:hypothetical protein
MPTNVDNPSGFTPVGHLFGLDWSDKIRWYIHPAADSVAIFKGDAVTGGIGSDATGKFKIVKQAAAGASAGAFPLGVAIAFRTDAPDSQPVSLVAGNEIPRKEFCPADTLMYIGVVDDPYVIFEIQEDSVSESIIAAEVGANCDFIVGTGSAVTALSAMELDSNTAAATSTLGVRILELSNDQKNTIGTNAKWRVIFNEHLYRDTTGTPVA